ncbi:glycosyltransferase family 2 protein [Solwaraspora sp. WMMD1047]|uniref:glycosyltransferase family 2 protein n=1 Tax=Solwaraspora sp. WMMD1047 TaxID=3016102 RepID=UPI002415BF90|nr:glycosyltransferase family 2 protein [Solwaraspora sp. WMMD1047]MDG4831981.1 glycosyltransferase family 2 protein [Solwaraspora sp. WMMD1047]
MTPIPEVSVVVPTLNRPALVARAVRSALAQTVPNIEVLVVVDGPDPATRAALDSFADHRLRVIGLPARGGAPSARNAGVRAARAPWTALLDDDDEWLPTKLAVQLDLARRATAPLPIVGSRLINRTPRAEFVIPRRLPASGESLSEYLTVRRGLFHGDGFIQTSTILAPTRLLRRVPFDPAVPRMQELDWTLRALAHDDVELLIADQPLVIWHQDEDRPRISLHSPWQRQLEWLRRSRPLFTPRAYAAVTMSVISSMAAGTRSPKVFGTLWREAHRHGRPGPLDYLTFLQIWLIPPTLRHRLRDLALTRPSTGTAGSPPDAGARPDRESPPDNGSPASSGAAPAGAQPGQ